MVEVQIDSLEDKWGRVLPALNRMVKRYAHILHHPQLRDVYGEVQLKRGMALALAGKFREALPLLKQTPNFTPSLITGDVYRELGRCYIHTGDCDIAETMLTKALDHGLDEASAADAHYYLAVSS